MEARGLMSEKLRGYQPYVASIYNTAIGSKGTELVKLNANEMQMGPSRKAMEAAAAELSSCHMYPQPIIQKLKKRISEKIGKPENNIVVFDGANPAIQVIGEVFLNPEEEVVVCSPTYVGYFKMPQRYGAKLVEVHSDDGIHTQLDKIKAAITEKTKLVFVCNPNNPTGTLVDKNELEEFVNNLPEHIICVIDEAYFDWVSLPDYESGFKFVDDKHNVIVVRTFSKLYGMAGFRVGYTVANEKLTECINSVSSYHVTSRVSAAAALAALDDEEFVKEAKKNNTEQRAYLMKELSVLGMETVPSQAGFVYFKPDCDAQKITEMLVEYGVYIRPFGEYLRVSVGLPHQCKIFINALKEVLSELR